MNPIDDTLNGLIDVSAHAHNISFGGGSSFDFSFQSYVDPASFYHQPSYGVAVPSLSGFTKTAGGDSAITAPHGLFTSQPAELLGQALSTITPINTGTGTGTSHSLFPAYDFGFLTADTYTDLSHPAAAPQITPFNVTQTAPINFEVVSTHVNSLMADAMHLDGGVAFPTTLSSTFSHDESLIPRLDSHYPDSSLVFDATLDLNSVPTIEWDLDFSSIPAVLPDEVVKACVEGPATSLDEALGLQTENEVNKEEIEKKWISTFRQHFTNDEEVIAFRDKQKTLYESFSDDLKIQHIGLIAAFREKGDYPVPPLPKAEKTLDALLLHASESEEKDGKRFYRFGEHLLVEEELRDQFTEGFKTLAARSPKVNEIVCSLLDDVQKGRVDTSQIPEGFPFDQVDTKIMRGEDNLCFKNLRDAKITWNPDCVCISSEAQGSRQSPTEILIHELAHNHYFRNSPLLHRITDGTPNDNYSDHGEKIIIKGIEKDLKEALGEQPRETHYGINLAAIHPASNHIGLPKSVDGSPFSVVAKENISGKIFSISKSNNEVIVEEEGAKRTTYKREEILNLMANGDCTQVAQAGKTLADAYFNSDQICLTLADGKLSYSNPEQEKRSPNQEYGSVTELMYEETGPIGDDFFSSLLSTPPLTPDDGSMSTTSSNLPTPGDSAEGLISKIKGDDENIRYKDYSQLTEFPFEFEKIFKGEGNTKTPGDEVTEHTPLAVIEKPKTVIEIAVEMSAWYREHTRPSKRLGDGTANELAEKYLKDSRNLSVAQYLQAKYPDRFHESNERQMEPQGNGHPEHLEQRPTKKPRQSR